MNLLAPKVGLMEAMTVVGWLKPEGARVTAGEPVVVLETEKANVDVEAPITGQLVKIHVREGAPVMPGQLLAEIDEE